MAGRPKIGSEIDLANKRKKSESQMKLRKEQAAASSHFNRGTISPYRKKPVDPPSTAKNAPGPLATHGPNCMISGNKDHSNMVPSIPMHMSNASVLTLQSSGPLIYPGQIQQFSRKHSKKRSLDRAPQLCATCHHYRHHNAVHNKSHLLTCTVPPSEYNFNHSKGWCPCPDCLEGAKAVGYEQPMETTADKGKRALKTCTLCGHYKDYGLYKAQHVNKFCTVDKDEVRNKFKGYCNCDICEATALSMGRDKPLKIRKMYDEIES